MKRDASWLPVAANTVRVRDGKRRVQDGPYADTRDQLGGRDLAAAHLRQA